MIELLSSQVYLVHKASVQAMDSSPGGARGAVNSARVQAALHAVAQHAGSAVVDKEVQEYLGEKVIMVLLSGLLALTA